MKIYVVPILSFKGRNKVILSLKGKKAINYFYSNLLLHSENVFIKSLKLNYAIAEGRSAKIYQK